MRHHKRNGGYAVMARYTLPLSNLIDTPSQFEEGLTFDERLEKGRQWLFDFSYPYYDENTRKDFETHFIYHFYNREIGFETEQLFKFKLRTWLNLNMPYWNKMMETDDLIKEPLVNVNWTRTLDSGKDVNQANTVSGSQTSKGNDSSTTSASGESSQFTRNLETDTPDSRLSITSNEDGTGVIEYASGIDESKNTNKAKNEDSSKSNYASDLTSQSKADIGIKEKGNEVEHTKGNMGMKTESEMIELYRQILMKWEPTIFREMEELFMLLY